MSFAVICVPCCCRRSAASELRATARSGLRSIRSIIWLAESAVVPGGRGLFALARASVEFAGAEAGMEAFVEASDDAGTSDESEGGANESDDWPRAASEAKAKSASRLT